MSNEPYYTDEQFAETAYLPPVPEQGQPQAPYGYGTGQADAAETAYLPPIPGQGLPQGMDAAHDPYAQQEQHAAPYAQGGYGGGQPDAAETAYLPPVREDTPPPQGHAQSAAWPDGWERPAGYAPEAGQQAYAPEPAPQAYAAAAAQPGEPHALGEESAPTVYGAPARRRPKPSAAELRAQGGSPLIAPGTQPAAITAGIALLLALTAALGRPALAVIVLGLQAVTAAGWFRLNGMWPARQGIALAFAGGLSATAGMVITERADAPAAAIGALGVWCVLIIVLQLRSTADSDDRLASLTATVAATVLAVLAAGYLAAEQDAVVVGAIAVGVGTLIRAVPLPPKAAPVVSILAATLAGLLAGLATDIGAAGALLGLAAGGCALIGLRAASYDYPSRFVHLTAGVAMPLALATPAVYLLGRALA